MGILEFSEMGVLSKMEEVRGGGGGRGVEMAGGMGLNPSSIYDIPTRFSVPPWS